MVEIAIAFGIPFTSNDTIATRSIGEPAETTFDGKAVSQYPTYDVARVLVPRLATNANVIVSIPKKVTEAHEMRARVEQPIPTDVRFSGLLSADREPVCRLRRKDATVSRWFSGVV